MVKECSCPRGMRRVIYPWKDITTPNNINLVILRCTVCDGAVAYWEGESERVYNKNELPDNELESLR